MNEQPEKNPVPDENKDFPSVLDETQETSAPSSVSGPSPEQDQPDKASAPQEKERPASSPGLKGGVPLLTVKPPSPDTLWTEMVVAINYLTRFNFKVGDTTPRPRLIRRSMGWFPLPGVLIGFFGAAIDWLFGEFGMPGLITSTFAVVGMLWLTRALHEEEFASLINRYSQSWDQDKDGGWLREERSISYGTLAIILLIIIKIAAIANFNSSEVVFCGLITAGAFSRAAMVLAAAWLRPIKGDPVADYFQQPPTLRVVMALVFAGLILFALLDSFALQALGVGLVVGLGTALVAGHYLRGYNGQLLGSVQQVVEVAILTVILSVQ